MLSWVLILFSHVIKMNESRANRWQTTIWSRISLKSALSTVGENDFFCVCAQTVLDPAAGLVRSVLAEVKGNF